MPVRIETPHGPARAHIHEAGDARGALMLGHGAGGGVEAPDLVAAAEAAQQAGFSVALIEQPYRVAGRKSQVATSKLDEAWIAIAAHLVAQDFEGLPLITGGRSAGARVACRTAAESGAAALLCLAFPVHPPGKGGDPSKSRLFELDAVEVPILVVQGEKDPFGMPPEAKGRKVAGVPGNHSLRSTAPVAEAVGEWLDSLSL